MLPENFTFYSKNAVYQNTLPVYKFYNSFVFPVFFDDSSYFNVLPTFFLFITFKVRYTLFSFQSSHLKWTL